MTVFKITRKKVTFGGVPTAAEEYKKNLRKNEEEKSDQPPTSSFSFGLIKDSPEVGSFGFVNQLKSGGSDKNLARNLFAALPIETNGFAISKKNKQIVGLRQWKQLNCLLWTASLV
jgi:hypothetical protein